MGCPQRRCPGGSLDWTSGAPERCLGGRGALGVVGLLGEGSILHGGRVENEERQGPVLLCGTPILRE